MGSKRSYIDQDLVPSCTSALVPIAAMRHCSIAETSLTGRQVTLPYFLAWYSKVSLYPLGPAANAPVARWLIWVVTLGP